jgi:hypothetical protein
VADLVEEDPETLEGPEPTRELAEVRGEGPFPGLEVGDPLEETLEESVGGGHWGTP